MTVAIQWSRMHTHWGYDIDYVGYKFAYKRIVLDLN